jgi:predicted  nucleic acid-binding Zn-ribbon protein
MAGRTSVGVGLGAFITILGIASLGLFSTTVIFYSQKRGVEKRLADRETQDSAFITSAERNSDDIASIKALAQRERKSVTGYLREAQQEAMQRVTGSRRDSLDDLKAKLERVGGADSQNLLALLSALQLRITTLETQLKDAQAAADSARADKEAEVARIGQLEQNVNQTIAAMTAEVEKYKQDAEEFRGKIDEGRTKMDERVDRVTQESRDRESRLQAEIDRLEQEARVNLDRIRRLQDEIRGKTYEGRPEFALVDGEVVGLDTVDNTVIIGLGRKQKLVLGLTFEVYSEASSIKPDAETGEYAPGKATVEVIRVDENSSVGRVVRERRGNPVVRGDVLANALYDPNKKYKFTIWGNFDADRDGVARPDEQQAVRARIVEWGGEVVDTLSGDVDFLVLGTRPVLPPEPPSTAPDALVDNYVKIREVVNRYDQLLEAARASNVPVLNENRLYTLTGWR